MHRNENEAICEKRRGDQGAPCEASWELFEYGCYKRAGISALPEDDAYDYPMLSLELLGEASPEERAVVTVRVTVAEVGDAFQDRNPFP
ncbi:hypothetical protein AK812_SmicGene40120 [Symbiodinium microadriaticum]|uniref:Uncharacterized protein n=1 Tax=Symbiodinium microadriaticum TaxID=2951 RepID=A0A1Q9C9J2_SYMMI|nr:hypothetical protein AK812_SmicGene40120 [Symbiodinium microadriaticum]